jgi:magnesium and cobalt transporter
VPQRGEVVSHPAGWDIEVLDADPRRVKRVRLRRVERIELAEAAPADA